MDIPTIINLLLVGGTLAMGIYGAYKGAIHQVGSVAGFLLGYLGAKLFATSITDIFHWPPFLSYILVFCTIFICVIILSRMLKLTVKMLLLGPVDRLIGMLIGCVKWLLGSSLVINFIWMCGFHPVWLTGRIPLWVGAFATRLFGLVSC